MRASPAAWTASATSTASSANYSEAASFGQRAIDRYEEIGDRLNQALCLVSLGDSLAQADEPAAAAGPGGRLAIFEAIGHPEAEQVRPGSSGSPPAGAVAASGWLQVGCRPRGRLSE